MAGHRVCTVIDDFGQVLGSIACTQYRGLLHVDVPYLGAFERHVLQKVCCAIVDFSLISAASIYPYTDGSRVREWSSLRCNSQSARESCDLQYKIPQQVTTFSYFWVSAGWEHSYQPV